MRKIGDIILELREGKGLSQTELAQGILSKSQLSKAENGLTTLSVDKFLALLDRLNVSLSEFSRMMDNQENAYWTSLLDDITGAVASNDLQQAQFIEKRALNHYGEQPTVTHQLQLIMVRIMLSQIDTKSRIKQKTKDITYLTNYLFKTEQWTNFELIIYGNTMGVLPLEMVNQISLELIERTKHLQRTSESLQLVFALLYATVILNLENSEFINANKLVQVMQNTEISEQELPIRFYIQLSVALTKYCQFSNERNKKQIFSVLNILPILGADESYLFFLNQIKDVTAKIED